MKTKVDETNDLIKVINKAIKEPTMQAENACRLVISAFLPDIAMSLAMIADSLATLANKEEEKTCANCRYYSYSDAEAPCDICHEADCWCEPER